MQHAANALHCVVSLSAHIFILHPPFLWLSVSCVPLMGDNINMNSKEMGFEYLNCIHLIRVRVSEHGDESSGPIKCTEFVEQLMAAHSATAPASHYYMMSGSLHKIPL